ncbi:MAG: hypothetical protein NDI88_01530 [Lysobacter sp.]|nr:hypothetical protein [Lysobacter sp.]
MKTLLRAIPALLLALASHACLAAPSVDILEPLSLDTRPLSGRSLAELEAALGIGASARSPWYALDWRDGELHLEAFRGLRERPGTFDWKRPEADTRFAEPDYAQPPLMVFRVPPRGDGPEGGRLETGTMPGLNVDETVRDGWRRELDLGGRRWILRADAVKAPGGRSLPGSMRLTVAGESAAPQVVLGRHAGLVFREQAVLWAGDLTGDGRPDFLLRRTLATGEVDHILSVSRIDGTYAATGVTHDPDKPDNGFSSGIEESEYEEWRRANSPRPYPEYRLPEARPATPAAYALSGPMKVKGIAIYANPQGGLLAPGVKRDFVFAFAGESYRMLAELVPTWQGRQEGPSYFPQLPFGLYGSGGGLTLVVSVQHRGVKQALLVTQALMDDGPMTLSAGDLDGSGRLSIAIDWMPHYNNAMSHAWTRAQEPGRLMKRTSSFQSQGC